MKTLLLMTSIIFTSVAFAYERPNPKMSWKKLRRERTMQRVYFQLPQYQLSDGYFLWGDKVCLTGENLDMIEPIGKKSRMKCVEWDNGERENCIKYKKVFPKIAVSGTRFGCLEWDNSGDDRDCVQYGQVPYTYKTEHMIKVTKHTGNEDGQDHSNYGRFLFNKELNLPACSLVD